MILPTVSCRSLAMFASKRTSVVRCGLELPYDTRVPYLIAFLSSLPSASAGMIITGAYFLFCFIFLRSRRQDSILRLLVGGDNGDRGGGGGKEHSWYSLVS